MTLSAYFQLCGCAYDTDFRNEEDVQLLEQIVETMVDDEELRELIQERIDIAKVITDYAEINRLRIEIESLFDFIENPPPFDEGKLA